MAVESYLYSALSGHAGLAALVGTRISPRRSLEGGAFPCVTYFRVSGGRELMHDGEIALNDPLYQISAWATDYDSLVAVADQIRSALRAITGEDTPLAEITDERDMYESDTDKYQRAFTIRLWNDIR